MVQRAETSNNDLTRPFFFIKLFVKCDSSGGARDIVDCGALNLVAGHAITGYSFLSIQFARDQESRKLLRASFVAFASRVAFNIYPVAFNTYPASHNLIKSISQSLNILRLKILNEVGKYYYFRQFY